MNLIQKIIMSTTVGKKEKAVAPHSSTLAWKIPWTEEPGRLHSMGSLRVGHDWETSVSLFTFMHWRRKWQPTPVFLPGESQRQWAPVYGVTQSWTRLKWLSSSMLLQNLFLCNCKTGLQFLAGLQSEASFSSLGPIWFIVTWSPSHILW